MRKAGPESAHNPSALSQLGWSSSTTNKEQAWKNLDPFLALWTM